MPGRIGMMAALAVLMAGCAGTTPPVTEAAATPATVADAGTVTENTEADEPTRICRSTRVTGSKFSRRVCGSAEYWAGIDRATETQMEEMRRSRGPQSGCSGQSCR